MKHSDIHRIHEAGLITEDQRRAIIEHFHLREDTQRFLAVLLLVGAVLMAAGVLLVVSANWEEIPDWVKIGAGILLLLGAHAGGCFLRSGHGRSPKAGEALHTLGALLFLGNIALIGQIFHLASRLPNAFLIWFLGIAPLPWILRSRPLFVLSAIALGFWVGAEAWQSDSWLAFGGGGFPFMLLALLGLLLYGLGVALQPTGWSLFSSDAERLGLLLFSGALFPFTQGPFHQHALDHFSGGSRLPFLLMATAALGLLAWALPRGSRLARIFHTPSSRDAARARLARPALAPEWRWAWGGMITVLVAYLGVTLLVLGENTTPPGRFLGQGTPLSWVGTLLIATFALVQVRVGVHTGSVHLVNLGVALVALVILATYLTLIESMGRTGMVFIVSGAFLIGFGIYLEKQRRKWLHRIQLQHA